MEKTITYHELKHVVLQEMFMYDELSKTEKLKIDRNMNKAKWECLNDILKEFDYLK